MELCVDYRSNAACLSKPSENIYSESPDKGLVPRKWRRAYVTAIFERVTCEVPFKY